MKHIQSPNSRSTLTNVEQTSDRWVRDMAKELAPEIRQLVLEDSLGKRSISQLLTQSSHGSYLRRADAASHLLRGHANCAAGGCRGAATLG